MSKPDMSKADMSKAAYSDVAGYNGAVFQPDKASGTLEIR